MIRYGFIRTKEDIKFLILYAMGFLTEPVSFDAVVDICTWCDDGFGYFELSEAFQELVGTGHLREYEESEGAQYAITPRGREAAEVFEKKLPFTVREAAQKSALRVVRKQRRDAAIRTEVTEAAENDFIVTLTMEEVFSLDMHVVSRAQASLLEKNFRGNAEKMYQTILNALIQDGTESEDDAK
ncbi:MAG: DUF4364 family protein [Clostridiaceae bacterium]|nr:DUF4364 family protein [Clostridiaceae bacterium]